MLVSELPRLQSLFNEMTLLISGNVQLRNWLSFCPPLKFQQNLNLLGSSWRNTNPYPCILGQKKPWSCFWVFLTLAVYVKMYFWLCSSGKCGASVAQLTPEQQPHNQSPAPGGLCIGLRHWLLALVLSELVCHPPALAIAGG